MTNANKSYQTNKEKEGFMIGLDKKTTFCYLTFQVKKF